MSILLTIINIVCTGLILLNAQGVNLGSTILTTDSTDTLSEFRTNTNTSLTNLNTDKLESGSTAASLTITSATLTNGTSTTIYVSGPLQVNGASSTIANLITVGATTTALSVSDLASTTRLTVTNPNATTTIFGNLRIGKTGGGNNQLELDCDGAGGYSNSVTVGGCMNLSFSGLGSGLNVRNTAGSSGNGRTINWVVSNTANPQAGVHGEYAGTANAFEIVHTSDDASSQALNVVSVNTQDTAFGLAGAAVDKGVQKITGDYYGTANSSASLLSLLASSTVAGTQIQGIFMDSSAGFPTTGKLLNLRNDAVELLTLDSAGQFGLGSSTMASKVNFAVQATTTNATTTISFGKSGTAGACFTFYDMEGVAVFVTISPDQNAFNFSRTVDCD